MLAYVQSLMAVACVLLVYVIGRRFLAPGWALFAAFLTAICPSLVVMPTYMPWLHHRVLEWQGYWPRELSILRQKLRVEIDARAKAAQ